MNKVTATQLINQTFDSAFDEQQFETFVANLLNQVERGKAFNYRSGNIIPQPFQGHISTYRRPFVYYDPQGQRLDVLIVRLHKSSSLERARVMQRNFAAWYLKQPHAELPEAALIAFYHADAADWRFSFVQLEYLFGESGAETKLTPARRYSFLVGPTEPTHTAVSQLLPFLLRETTNPALADLQAAFQIETVSKHFFESYKELFLRLVEAIESLLHQDKRLAADFQRADIHVPHFAKKLLGQIVFLYFVQKKGWLGVEPGRPWGSGPKDFLRRLFERAAGNFFNDLLEPLFYDALAVQRLGDLFSLPGYTCQIPFLNGGLFEPMGGYDWRNTHLLLPDSLFSNRQDEKDDSGTGILDVFDRYNFTVWEEEPLEKEVAVDPEMLGKVFENLLKVQDRKSKGAFYTPREIVHYMCQESLINYLHTQIGSISEIEPISRDDIAILVRQGALALQQDVAKEAGLQKGEHVLPLSVRAQAALLDEALARIKLCDPAIGSGAFPVGMLQEIVQARLALDTQLKRGVTAYQLKLHAIQESIYGVDIDAGAVEIAKLRLWLSLVVDETNYEDIHPLPNLDYKIVCGNSLLGVEKNLLNYHLFERLDVLKAQFFGETHHQEKAKQKAQIDQLIELLTGDRSTFDFEVYFHEAFAGEDGGFDLVIGNPPYGALVQGSKENISNYRFPHSYDLKDTYMLFMELGVLLLRKEGILSFITPNTWLQIFSASRFRKFFVENHILINVTHYVSHVFEQATVDTEIIVLKKSLPTERDRIAVSIHSRDSIKRYFVQQQRWIDKQGDIISIYQTDEHYELLSEIEQKSFSLEMLCWIKNGVKPFEVGKGNPPQTKEILKEKPYVQQVKLDDTFHPLLRGSLIQKYSNYWDSDYWISYGSWLAAPRDSSMFFDIPEKIVVRQTGDSIIGTIIDSSFVCRDNLHIIFLREKYQKYDLYYLLGVLNSKFMTGLYRLINPETGEVFAQVKASHLKKLPIRTIDWEDISLAKLHEAISFTVKDILEQKGHNPAANVSYLEGQIDQLVYQLYGLSPAEIALVEGHG